MTGRSFDPNPSRSHPPRPVVLCILDGWGCREGAKDNAIAAGKTPVFDRLMATAPHALLATSGLAVGLPKGQMGNSEVGHMNIGAGRVVMQDLPRIDTAIETGTLAENAVLRDLIAALRASGGTCHIMGLASPGGVHSHQDHISYLARLLADAGVPVRIHAFLDGRDTPPKSAGGFVETLEQSVADLPSVRIGTVSGRYYAMDRDKRWDRVELAYKAIANGEGLRAASPSEAISAAYGEDETDEFVRPRIIDGYDGLKDGDGLVMANFRADRAREILHALIDPGFDGFERAHVKSLAAVAGMTQYSSDLAQLMPAFFPPENLVNTLGEWVSNHAKRQLRIAETEKYAHVTFFLNGGREEVFEGEERILVPSPKVATYDLKPEMSAPEVTDKLVDAIENDSYDLIVVNYANPDMVGHTGDFDAALKAVATVDRALGRLETALVKVGGVMLVTADHGNIEMMIDPQTREPHTAHTTFDVPLVLVNSDQAGSALRLKDGRLADLAPTVLALMGIAPPTEMSGESLLCVAEGATTRDVHADITA